MKKIAILVALATAATSTAAVASHDPTTPYTTRGECESAAAQQSAADWDFVMDASMGFFTTRGEVASMLTRQYTCDLGEDGQWYITNRRFEVMESDWFEKRYRN